MSIQSAIQQFGQRLGMPSLAMGREGVTALDISGVGRLHLEISSKSGHEELLACLMRNMPTHDQDIARRALAFCHYRHAHSLPLWVGMHKENLMVITRFNESEATGQALENAVIFLADSLNSICDGSK
ncbi:MAG: CesT family type III secretion system chaperone [Desulfovibrio sp.]|nr:CesT family type III secretion system chaperone [Desulfovibrio sp.]